MRLCSLFILRVWRARQKKKKEIKKFSSARVTERQNQRVTVLVAKWRQAWLLPAPVVKAPGGFWHDRSMFLQVPSNAHDDTSVRTENLLLLDAKLVHLQEVLQDTCCPSAICPQTGQRPARAQFTPRRTPQCCPKKPMCVGSQRFSFVLWRFASSFSCRRLTGTQVQTPDGRAFYSGILFLLTIQVLLRKWVRFLRLIRSYCNRTSFCTLIKRAFTFQML